MVSDCGSCSGMPYSYCSISQSDRPRPGEECSGDPLSCFDKVLDRRIFSYDGVLPERRGERR